MAPSTWSGRAVRRIEARHNDDPRPPAGGIAGHTAAGMMPQGGAAPANPAPPVNMTKTVLLIAGMVRSGCRERVTRALEGLPGVIEVEVNLYRGKAAVVHGSACGIDDLIRAVKSTGYGAALEAS
jgi:copper chaperone CopZ